MPADPRPPTRVAPRPIRVVIGLAALIVLTQLIVLGLGALRPASLPTLFAGAATLADARAPALGPPGADVVIYLFSDYACTSCRALHVDLRRLAGEDPGVRIVYRDWPILGERSVRAARLALATVGQHRHAAFDDELMRRGGSLDETALRAAAARAGVDWRRLERDLGLRRAAIDALLADTARRATGLGFAGTPVVVIGPYLVVGRARLDRLRDLVAEARRWERG